MQVHVKLYSRFRRHLPPDARGEATVELPDGATLGELVDQLGLVKPVKLITVNGQQETDRGRPLGEGDSVRLFPIVVGG
jgi:molybdopterin converting factor small subunit